MTLDCSNGLTALEISTACKMMLQNADLSFIFEKSNARERHVRLKSCAVNSACIAMSVASTILRKEFRASDCSQSVQSAKIPQYDDHDGFNDDKGLIWWDQKDIKLGIHKILVAIFAVLH